MAQLLFASGGSAAPQAPAPAQLVYINPGFADPANGIYDDWATLYAAYLALPADKPVNILFTLAAAPPLTIPAGTWTFKPSDKFIVATGIAVPFDIILSDGCLIENVYWFEGSATWVGRTTGAPQLAWPFSGAIGGAAIVFLTTGSQLRNEGTSPMIVWDTDASFGAILVLALNLGAQLNNNGAAVAPILQVAPSGAFTSVCFVVCALLSGIGPDTIGTVDGTGVALLGQQVQAPSAVVDGTQSFITGVIPFGDATAYNNRCPSRETFDAFFPDAGPYTFPTPTPNGQTGGGLLRVRPNGSLIPIDVFMPPAISCIGMTYRVKRDNPDVVTTITVFPAGADLIDGAASYALPATSYAARSFVSDGFHWMVI